METHLWRAAIILTLSCWPAALLQAGETVTHPFVGITVIARSETSPRAINMHIVKIDLTAPGIGFELTPPGGTQETVRQTTLAFLNQEHAQLAINAHFFLPFPSFEINSILVGLAASNGNVYSSFETPEQTCCIVADAPALNIDVLNHASIVHYNPSFVDGMHVMENVSLWNTVAGSAQIITNGKKTIPVYRDASHPDGVLTPGGPDSSSNSNSWYALKNSRTVIGLSQDNRTLFLFTVDKAGGSLGMSIEEVADLLISDYGVYNALNLDGGGSTTMAMQDPATGVGAIINVSSDNPKGRFVACNLAVFALVP